ncbi:MAG TPA: endoribonuclease MazF [Candidatus Baltobacteraceae bacterium]|nr:endoribonuclease MazF [Candidatus Baltobacteraceae bacterium]
MKHYVPDRGDIAWVDFSPNAGHEQGKRRPALVLTAKRYNAASGFAVVCPITSQTKNYVFEVALDQTRTAGVVIADQFRSFDWRARGIEFRERVPEDVLDDVLAKIIALLQG